jgi:hypothetical protein
VSSLPAQSPNVYSRDENPEFALGDIESPRQDATNGLGDFPHVSRDPPRRSAEAAAALAEHATKAAALELLNFQQTLMRLWDHGWSLCQPPCGAVLARKRKVMSAGPRPGDVLVSNHSATVEHDISIVPRAPHITCATHRTAVVRGGELAKELKVDAWLTEDHTHFLMIDSYRAAP